MKNGVKDIDRGWKDLKKGIQEAKGAYTKVGIQQDAKRKDASPMVTVAYVHEFGHDALGIPERSFLRWTFDNHAPQIRHLLDTEMKRIVQGKSTAGRSLSMIGQWYRAKVQERIRSNIPPELAESTKAARRNKNKAQIVALIDTAQLIQTIREVVVLHAQELQGAAA